MSATLWKSPKAPKAARALAFYVSGAELGRSLMMPPGVPVDRVKVLCVAFRAMIEDPELLAEIAKSGQEFQPASDEQVEKLVREVASAPPRDCRTRGGNPSGPVISAAHGPPNAPPSRRLIGSKRKVAAANWRSDMSLSVVPLSPALGAEIKGIDLRKPLDQAAVRALNDAFDQNIVLIVRGQELSEDDQLRAAGYFGKVRIRRRPANGRGPGGEWDTPFMMVTNIVENGQPIGAFGDGEMWFHHDTSYYPEPNRATLLYSLKITSRGGQTCFSNMYKAYENIPRPLRDKLEGRKVLQVHDYKRRERIDLEKVDVSALLHHEQPIFVTHPASGKKALYVSRLMSAHIEGLSTRESEAVLDQLFEISEDPSIIYEHDWQLGDLVIWDNWCSIHMRKDFPREEPRLMRRLTIEGQAMRF